MKLIIDIPDELYEDCKHTELSKEIEGLPFHVIKLVANGIPLSKGCGRLIDAKALEDAMYHEAFEVDSDMQKWDSGNWIRYKMFENAIKNAPTIIESR